MVGSTYLKDADQFWDVIQQHTNVKAVLCGHVHQDMNTWCTSHGNTVDLRAIQTEFQMTLPSILLSPGWREIELHQDGTVSTQVHRLPLGQFLPDFEAAGY